ncbi:MAG: exopolysaccharide biosynthesis protein [Nitrosomonas sp.]|nr:exopolysaccharide biosynthesis protein [Nitrosomonas sp.]
MGTLDKLITKAAPWLRKIESHMHPRLTYISVHAWERTSSASFHSFSRFPLRCRSL